MNDPLFVKRLREHVGDHLVRLDEVGEQHQHQYRAFNEHGCTLIVSGTRGRTVLCDQQVHRLVVPESRCGRGYRGK